MNNQCNAKSEAKKVEEIVDDLDDLCGTGSFGSVYFLKSTDGDVVKEIQVDSLTNAHRRALEVELKLLFSVQHSNIVHYKEIIRSDQFIYIRMKRYKGSLASEIIVRKRKTIPFPPEVIFKITRQIASALMYLHCPTKKDSNGNLVPVILHRDLKPDNILIGNDETNVVIADFGLCREGLCSQSSTAGTHIYMAPEVQLRKEYLPASDIWSLGCIIYEMCTLSRMNPTRSLRADRVFVDGWKPDLELVTDMSIREILKCIFVLEPENRITAKDLVELLSAGDRPADIFAIMKYQEMERKSKGYEDRIVLLEKQVRELINGHRELRSLCREQQNKIAQLEEKLESSGK